MTDLPAIDGDGFTLLPVPAAAVAEVLRVGLAGHLPGRGWPHRDSADGLSFARAGGWAWVVVDDDGAVVGECGTKAPPADDGTVEIGYGLAAPSRGRGLGGRVVRSLTEWLLARPEVRAVTAETAPANVASRRALERAGFAVVDADDTAVWYRRTKTPRDGRPRRG